MPTGICDWATIRAAMKRPEPSARRLAIKAKQAIPAIHEDDISTQVSDIDIEHDKDQVGGAHNSSEEFPDDSLDRSIAQDLGMIEQPPKKSLFVKLPVSQYNNADEDQARSKTNAASRVRIEKTRILSPSKLVNRQSPTKQSSRRALPTSPKPQHVPVNERRKSKRIRGQVPDMTIPRSPVAKVAKGHPSRIASARQLATGPGKENASPSETRVETQRKKRPQTAATGSVAVSKRQRMLR
ncbi:hypothetical protein BDZ85DRAFT_101209 [Elsinoe ampelina]|uniref:Uncharacterized protein n=1 Tax=Elsinoe ampelina TaxID=302913 RepID=A0A6A6GFH7_9PEZI|nr:hypothetical protein BDZ85DRAFT_101209 [Elsinoe ampelina]